MMSFENVWNSCTSKEDHVAFKMWRCFMKMRSCTVSPFTNECVFHFYVLFSRTEPWLTATDLHMDSDIHFNVRLSTHPSTALTATCATRWAETRQTARILKVHGGSGGGCSWRNIQKGSKCGLNHRRLFTLMLAGMMLICHLCNSFFNLLITSAWD